MEMTIPGFTRPEEMVRALGVLFSLGTATLVFAAWLHRATRIGVMAVLAKILFGGSAAILLMMGLSLIYPHHHHNVRWTARADANYFIDVAIGHVFWAAVVLCYLFVWRRDALRTDSAALPAPPA